MGVRSTLGFFGKLISFIGFLIFAGAIIFILYLLTGLVKLIAPLIPVVERIVN